jgi:hypothetical protein
MPIPLKLICNAVQASRHAPLSRLQFGYLTALTVDQQLLAADLRVAEALAGQVKSERNLPAPFHKAAVGILEVVDWPSGRRSAPISLTLLLSAKNSGELEMFLRRQQPAASAQASFGLQVYQWDYKQSCYYVRFATSSGSSSSSGSSISAVFGSGTIEESPLVEGDLGAILYRVALTFHPPTKEEKFHLGTSQVGNNQLSWGEPESGGASELMG